MESKLKRIGERAGNDPRERFTSIYHHVYARENLRASYEAMEEDKAPGVDGVSKAAYGWKLEGKPSESVGTSGPDGVSTPAGEAALHPTNRAARRSGL